MGKNPIRAFGSQYLENNLRGLYLRHELNFRHLTRISGKESHRIIPDNHLTEVQVSTPRKS